MSDPLYFSKEGYFYSAMVATIWWAIAAGASLLVMICLMLLGGSWYLIAAAALVITASQAWSSYEFNRGYMYGTMDLWSAAYPDEEFPEVEFVD